MKQALQHARTGEIAVAEVPAPQLLPGCVLVRIAASLQGVIDAFVVVGGLTAFALLIVVATSRAPPGPASHRPLFGRVDGPPQ